MGSRTAPTGRWRVRLRSRKTATTPYLAFALLDRSRRALVVETVAMVAFVAAALMVLGAVTRWPIIPPRGIVGGWLVMWSIRAIHLSERTWTRYVG